MDSKFWILYNKNKVSYYKGWFNSLDRAIKAYEAIHLNQRKLLSIYEEIDREYFLVKENKMDFNDIKYKLY